MYLFDKLKSIRKSHFVRNVTVIGGSVAAAQILSLIFSPFLARLYGPESFGALAAYTAIVNIITPLATCGFSNAVVLPKDDKEALSIIRLSILCGMVVSPVALIIVHFSKPWLAVLTGLETESALLYLIPPSLLLISWLLVAEQSAIREGFFKPKARAYVESTFLMNFIKLAGGWILPTGLILIVATAIRQLLNFSMLLLRTPKKGAFCINKWFGLEGVRDVAWKYRDFPVYRMPQGIIRAISAGLPIIFLTTYFSSETAGQYSITVLFLSAPIMLLGASVGEVFYPKITRAIQNEPKNAIVLIQKTTLIMLLLGIIPFGLISILGQEIFLIILGEEWRRAGQFSQWIALWMAAMLIVQPILTAMPALGMQASMLVFEIATLICRGGALYFGFYADSDLIAVSAFSVVSCIGILFTIFWVFVRVRFLK